MGAFSGLLLALPLVIKSLLEQAGVSESCSTGLTDLILAGAAAVGLPILATSKPVGKK